MGFVAFAFLVVFVLIASAGLLLFYREAMVARIAAVVMPRGKQEGWWRAIRETGSSVGGMVEQLEGMIPKSQAEVSVVQQRLIRAGYRGETALDFFYGAKVLAPLGLGLLALATDYGRHNWFFAAALALGLGFLAPDFWLGQRIARRQLRIRSGLPDVLDLIVVCIEAGLSVDQATARTAEELRMSQPELSDELGIVVLEQRAGRPRSEAWREFADRTAVDSVRNLVSVLVQSEQLGTSVAKTLRTHSDTLRTQRSQRVEEQAAKTTIKLVFPLVLLIFPSLFLVTLGPALIIMSESFDKFLKQ
jgi:tight adherence protein C